MKTNGKTRRTMLAGALALSTFMIADAVRLDDVFREFHSLLQIEDVTPDEFIASLQPYGKSWEKYYLNRPPTSSQSMAGWFVKLVNGTIPECQWRDESNRWQRVKAIATMAIAKDAYVREDTNCWVAVAREIGDLRKDFLPEDRWIAHKNVVLKKLEITPDGVLIAAVTNVVLTGDFILSTPSPQYLLEEDDLERRAFVSEMTKILSDFLKSETFMSMSPSERDAIVSNIVSTARMTPEAAAENGLTNFAGTVSRDSGAGIEKGRQQ